MRDTSHHRPGGGFRNPWPTANGDKQPSVLRWWAERRRENLPPDPGPGQLPTARPEIVHPPPATGEIRATWIGHASFLIQMAGQNLLLDPHFSERASPSQRFGPRRFTPPGVALESLPPIDGVIISHNHYDHLDEQTVRTLIERDGQQVSWFAPLGHRDWLRRRGTRAVVELDWWETATLGDLTLQLLPAQHWSSRSPFDRFRVLWGSWAVRSGSGASLYFGGDSGWFPGYQEIGERAGPFDLVLLPIGAYAPRWFMQVAHMNPEEAVQAYDELGGGGVLGAMHWGTFRLTDEDPLEPPRRLRAAWDATGHSPSNLWIPAHGETLRVPSG